ncbi:gp9 [Mycobacterium phage Omega]|uniref:Uncharacterized protein n=1 Tax=Mycobacterium phage Omega TaxID=2907835 RepID=Q854Q5_BPMOM|nr:gp9 [Mycobacterium phage Omega]AAN12653.1 hypothetical protein PBI_OMEGA_9 [Mycobacterium phage Omega]
MTENFLDGLIETMRAYAAELWGHLSDDLFDPSEWFGAGQDQLFDNSEEFEE